jgi:hypothetical protein
MAVNLALSLERVGSLSNVALRQHLDDRFDGLPCRIADRVNLVEGEELHHHLSQVGHYRVGILQTHAIVQGFVERLAEERPQWMIAANVSPHEPCSSL